MLFRKFVKEKNAVCDIAELERYIESKECFPDNDNLKYSLSHIFYNNATVDIVTSNEYYSDIPYAYHGSLPSRCANQPKDLSIKLYEYQAKGLGW